MSPEPIAEADRLAADVFGKSYREYLELKPTHYRWSRLAPQGVERLAEAHEHKWSVEKVADYLNCGAAEAEACLRRYVVSKKVNARDGEAARLKQALAEWVGLQTGMEELPEPEKRRRAGELALIVANHLFASARAGDDIMKLSKDLEGAAGGEDGSAPSRGDAEPPKWGPRWKD